MRWMKDEEGATAVVVGLLLVVLLGFGAISVDVGAMYQERRELQNGADAAVLAGAQDCATGVVPCVITGAELNGTIDEFASENANDGESAADIVSLDIFGSPPHLTVETSTISDGAGSLRHWFAGILGTPSSTIRAQATATWDRVGGAGTLPLTMSQCEFDRFTAGGTVYAAEPFDPATQQIIFFHDGRSAEPCHSYSSGMDIPGGFGWLVTDSGTCSVQLTADSYASEDPGSSASTGCDASVVRAMLGTTVLVPVFDEAAGLGANGTYHIYGFAAFHLTSYRLGGSPEWNAALPGYAAPCRGDERCIGGHFTRFVDMDGIADGSSPDLGVVTVSLTN